MICAGLAPRGWKSMARHRTSLGNFEPHATGC